MHRNDNLLRFFVIRCKVGKDDPGSFNDLVIDSMNLVTQFPGVADHEHLSLWLIFINPKDGADSKGASLSRAGSCLHDDGLVRLRGDQGDGGSLNS